MTKNHCHAKLPGLTNNIDHTMLKTSATRADSYHACEQSIKYQFISLCINPCCVSLAHKEQRENWSFGAGSKAAQNRSE